MNEFNRYGGGCRCLLRLRENEGKPGLSDAAFFARFAPRYPEWAQQPGCTDAYTLMDLARGLGLAGHMEISRDYDRVLRALRSGHRILVRTERAPEQQETASAPRDFTLLLETIDEEGFGVWCPYPSGQAEVLPRAARVWWDRWQCHALLLQRAL